MIPLQLRLRNFMSYRESDLDFSGLHTACLSGENGSGKSAIFDAITWALWEKARTNDSDQLIRLGEGEMQVEFFFELEGDRYRVLRSRQKGRGTSVNASLELQVLGPDGFRVISGKGIRETQRKINEILRMDYLTFINSSFLLQGRADEFTTRNPSDRKKVLADILGLSLYDDLQKLAKVEVVKYEAEWNQRQADVQGFVQRTQQLPEIQTALEASRQQIEALQLALSQTNVELQDIEAQVRDHAHQKIELEAIARHSEGLSQRLHQIELKAQRIGQQRQTCEAIIAQSETITLAHEEWSRLTGLEQEMSLHGNRYHELEREHRQLQKVIQAARHQIELDLHRQEERLRQLQAQQKEAEAIVSEREKILWGLEQAKQARHHEREYVAKLQHFQNLEADRHDIQNRIESYRQQVRSEHSRLQSRLEERLLQRDAGEEAKGKLILISQQLEHFKRLAVEIEHIRDKGVSGKQACEQFTAAIALKHAQIEELRHKIANLDVGEHDCPLCERPLVGEERSRLLTRYQTQIEELEHEINTAQKQIREQESLLEQLRRRYIDLNEQLKGREEIQQQYGHYRSLIDHGERAGQALEWLWDEQAGLIALMSDEDLLAPDLLGRMTGITEQLAENQHNPAQLAVLQARVQDWRWAEQKQSQLEQAEKSVLKLQREIGHAQSELLALRDRLDQHDFARPELTQIEAIEKELSILAYDPHAHQGLRDRLVTLQAAPISFQELVQSRQQQSLLDQESEHLREEEQDLRSQMTDDHLRLEGLPACEQALMEAQCHLAELKEKQRQEQEQIGKEQIQQARWQERLEAMEQSVSDLKKSEGERDRLHNEIELHRELAMAFGKNGIQALIIENAVPEIEHEANRLLSRMTEGRLHVSIVTCKENKTNDRINETLEIYISDELGTRNYELYSGGEAFRINFAIRLALSRLLARRVGAKLQTLIIDEGFGTQDAQGRFRLIETIKAIEGDFERILVITHMSDIKEAFPARIEVSKTLDGSQALIVIE